MFSKISGALVAFMGRFEREDGQALAEYGLLLALIAVACLAALTALGLAIAGILGSITGAL
jgi:pilus assembly protein Flp/PilA